jgi:hypothetical protein
VQRANLPAIAGPAASRRSELLTDLSSLEEDGDMALTVAGTRSGITAVQLEVSTSGAISADFDLKGEFPKLAL